MDQLQFAAYFLYAYGTFLLLCGIASVVFIGMKAKTALISGGMAGGVSLAVAWLMAGGNAGAQVSAMIWPMALFCVFAWRSTKTLQRIFVLIPEHHDDLNGKGIAFLIISLMAIVSIITCMLQVAVYLV
jgi:hypothetical protein